MKRLVMCACLAVFAFEAQNGYAFDTIPGEVIVWFANEDTTALVITDSTVTSTCAELNTIIQGAGVQTARPLFRSDSPARNIFLLVFPASTDLDSLVADLEALPCLQSVCKNHGAIMDTTCPVSDYAFNHDYREVGHSWEDAKSDLWTYSFMQVDRAWCITPGSSEIVVGIMDVGLDYQHPDFQGNIWINSLEDINQNGVFDRFPVAQGGDIDGLDNDTNGYVDDVVGWDFRYGDNDPSTDAGGVFGSHGTVMGSIIAARANNSTPWDTLAAAGISQHARLLALKVGEGNLTADEEAILEGLNYGARYCDIINMSMSTDDSPILREIVRRVHDDLGVILVSSAANYGSDPPTVPCSLPEVICVGAVLDTYYKTEDSNYGTSVDVCAPSAPWPTFPSGNPQFYKGIVTCTYTVLPPAPGLPPYPGSDSPYNYWFTSLRTSGAAAEVSGVCALLKSLTPSATPQYIETQLLRGCVPLVDPLYPQGKLGAGMVNAFRSLTQWGVIAQNTLWSGTVYISGDIRVAQGATLTIAPGTTVYVWPEDVNYALNAAAGGTDNNRVEIWVDGRLDAIGTNPHPINIVAFDQSGSTTDRDAWFGIFVTDQAGSGATLRFCNIRNARYGIQTNANIAIYYSNIRYCEKRGVSIAYTDSVYIRGTTIRDVDEYGVNVVQSSKLRITRSTLRDVGLQGLRVLSGSTTYVDTVTCRNVDTGVYVSRESPSFAVAATLRGCTINGNESGLWLNGPGAVTVQNCTMDSNTVAVYVESNGTDGVIEKSTLRHNGTAISYYASDAPQIDECVITENTVGIKFESYSGVSILHCTDAGGYDGRIASNSKGVLCVDSSPGFYQCKISSNTNGIWGWGDSAPDLMNAQCKLMSNSRHIRNLSEGVTIDAQGNYWYPNTGPPNYFPQTSNIGGSVDYSSALSSEPSFVLQWPAPTATPPKFVTALGRAHPNPFNPTVQIPYSLSEVKDVEIQIYDVSGRLVRTLAHGAQERGEHSVTWDGSGDRGSPVASSVYFVRMRAGAYTATQKIVLLK